MKVFFLPKTPSLPECHLYSKVDIMIEYINTEKVWFFKKHVPRGPCLGCQKQQKRVKGMFLRLIKIRDKCIFFTYYKHRIRL